MTDKFKRTAVVFKRPRIVPPVGQTQVVTRLRALGAGGKVLGVDGGHVALAAQPTIVTISF